LETILKLGRSDEGDAPDSPHGRAIDVESNEDEDVSLSSKGSGDEGDAPDSPYGRAIDVESNDPESPMSASSSYEEEEPTPPHQRVNLMLGNHSSILFGCSRCCFCYCTRIQVNCVFGDNGLIQGDQQH
jgi:hypothetical protein